MGKLQQLLECGQSYWLDNLTRDMLDSGELARRVETEGLRGMTSNPKTFRNAISSGSAYDDEFRELVERRVPIESIYESLAITDVRRACDVFRPVFEASNGIDGFVSLEVSPHLAHDAKETIGEARRLHAAVDRPNLFIKIPGTLAGLDAIEQMLYEGVNINITLLFSVPRYQAVAERYLRALERRLEDGKPIDGIRSVASFFLSRIDVLTDQLLSHRIVSDQVPVHARAESHFGKLAIASAKLAYRSFRQITEGERWQALADRGARVQRVLWASTSTKNPLYNDVKYVEPLIGPDTVNTMPRRTIEAFADHGTVTPGTIEQDVDDAEEVFEAMETLGLRVDFITQELENEGVEKFQSPFDDLMKTLAHKRRELVGPSPQTIAPGSVESKLSAAYEALDEIRLGRRLHAADPHLWAHDPAHADAIRQRLGWIESVERFRDELGDIKRFAMDAKNDFDRVLLLGMGGSSLSADVCREIFEAAPGWPELRVLDSTDPEEIASMERWASEARTLFVVASKSGTTTETLSFYRYFYDRVPQEDAGRRFVGITDPDTPLAKEGREKGFRRIFENPPDIGGRYSALSYFGLVPMALMGIDVDALLERAFDQSIACGPAVPVAANPALALGALLGVGAREGRDKVTFVPGGPVDAFAHWAEQLLAESTGKNGLGLVPVVDEPLAGVDTYSDDRIFVSLASTEPDPGLRALEKAGHPVVRIEIDEPLDVGGEFLRFELATAVAGMILGVNPFDEPNVTESKESTRNLLEEWQSRGGFEQPIPVAKSERLALYADERQKWLQTLERDTTLPRFLESFLSLARPRDYLCLLPYVARTADRHQKLQSLRVRLRDRLRIATTLGYGPRYLHSTGQLHKGGPDRGLFLFLTADETSIETEEEEPIPGREYGFHTLERAQALGDLRALHERGRRAVRIHLGNDIDAGLEELSTTLTEDARFARAT